jgi:aminopeptidase N
MRKAGFMSLGILCILAAAHAQVDILDSGGPLMPEQAAYDVRYYELSLQVFPDERRIEGSLEIRATVVHPMDFLVLDLDTMLTVRAIQEWSDEGVAAARDFHRDKGKLWIYLGPTRQSGESFQVIVNYGGRPRVAPNPPWNGGFTWEKTASGAHWIATTCQTNGADLWWPCKDHVSDEPDSMRLRVRVPAPLVAACNGTLEQMEEHDDGTRTYHWYIANPINIYNVALNIAPYRTIEGVMDCVTGERYPVVFYVLPEDYEKGQALFPEILEHLRFFEKLLGPYPFRNEKYGVAQTPHLGMEHQTIIAYGANFSNTSMTRGPDWGFDALHHHELAHEWWGNLVTNFDWRDMWLHEGFGSYMQALYVEELHGPERYREFMAGARRFGNTLAAAPRASRSAQEIYRAPIYNKGAWVLHTLRYVIGDEAFFRSLRRMAYPDPALERVTDGSQCRFATTDDFRLICEHESGRDLSWFFEVYLRQPRLPRLYSRVSDTGLSLRWEAPEGLSFPMPLEVEIDGAMKKIEVSPEGVVVPLKRGQKPVVDPLGWVLMEVVRGE